MTVRYLGLAFYGEGPKDYAFLPILLRRVCEHVCCDASPKPVEVGEVYELDDLRHDRDKSREDRIVNTALDARDAWHILFVHTDADGEPEDARKQRVQPALDLLRAELYQSHRGIAIVPVRETEAWGLVDGDALRGVLEVSLTDAQLKLPKRARGVEQVTDPKKVLNDAVALSCTTRHMSTMDYLDYLGPLAERVSLERLSAVPAFQAFKSDLRDALHDLGFTSP
jgi:hypothetical protein